jgi:hypothetical protein
MLAIVLTPPRDELSWARWSFNNYDAVNQIGQAIRAQYGVSLPDYALDPIDLNDFDTFLNNNQQAHTGFTGVLGQQSSDLLHVDFSDENQKEAWIYLNWMELFAACSKLGIGP